MTTTNRSWRYLLLSFFFISIQFCVWAPRRVPGSGLSPVHENRARLICHRHHLWALAPAHEPAVGPTNVHVTIIIYIVSEAATGRNNN